MIYFPNVLPLFHHTDCQFQLLRSMTAKRVLLTYAILFKHYCTCSGVFSNSWLLTVTVAHWCLLNFGLFWCKRWAVTSVVTTSKVNIGKVTEPQTFFTVFLEVAEEGVGGFFFKWIWSACYREEKIEFDLVHKMTTRCRTTGWPL